MKSFEHYKSLRSTAADLPSVQVDYDEFIRLLVDQDRTPREAELQAKAARALGSEVLIGERMVSIKAE